MKLIRAKVKTPYNYDGDKGLEKHKARILAMVALLGKWGITLNQERFDEGSNYSLFSSDEVLLSPEEYTDLVVEHKIEFESFSYLKTSSSKDGNPFEALMAKMEEVLKMNPTQGDVNYNSKCEVHTPGQALSIYNDTLLMEDACTDELQGKLTEGWRIIAACPQPDQRRPDYILGRYTPENK